MQLLRACAHNFLLFRAAMTHVVAAVTIHLTGLLDWSTGLDYWTELFSFLDRFLCLFLKEAHIFYNQQVADYYG